MACEITLQFYRSIWEANFENTYTSYIRRENQSYSLRNSIATGQ